MDIISTINTVVNLLTQGGPSAIIAILVMIIAALMYDRRRLVAEIAKRDDKVDRIVDDYHKGALTLAEAINSFRAILNDFRN